MCRGRGVCGFFKISILSFFVRSVVRVSALQRFLLAPPGQPGQAEGRRATVRVDVAYVAS